MVLELRKFKFIYYVLFLIVCPILNTDTVYNKVRYLQTNSDNPTSTTTTTTTTTNSEEDTTTNQEPNTTSTTTTTTTNSNEENIETENSTTVTNETSDTNASDTNQGQETEQNKLNQASDSTNLENSLASITTQNNTNIDFDSYYKYCYNNETKEHYVNFSMTNTTSLEEYLSNEYKNSTVIKVLKSILIDNSYSNVGEVLLPIIGPYLGIAIFIVISLFIWIILCVCVISPCLCCKKDVQNTAINKSSFDMVKYILSFLVILFCIAVIGVLGAGLYLSSTIENNFNSTYCTLIKFYLDSKYGEKIWLPENDNNRVKWLGTNYIVNNINDIQTSIDDIIQNTEDAFKGDPVAIDKNKADEYYNILDSKYKLESERMINNPSITKEKEKIIPGYISVILIKLIN